MICPRCLASIPDDAEFCPRCHAYVGRGQERADAEDAASGFVFCEGCGARLSPHDRVCPKCGRPAPGILSAESASSDLAAGRTASFPRLTQRMIDAEAERKRQQKAAAAPRPDDVAISSVDPFATNILRAADIERADAQVRADSAAQEDPYHRPRRRWPKVVAVILLAGALSGGSWYFVTRDPLGVMPAFYDWFSAQASTMFPSRQQPAASGSAMASVTATSSDGTLTDDEAYQKLTLAYQTIVDQHDRLDEIIDSYNASFVSSDLAKRREASSGAYASRDALDTVVAELKDMKLEDGSAYADEVENLQQLAGWVRTRVDIYCASWDLSLSYTGNDKPSSHQAEILAPLRERADEDAQARDAYFNHLSQYRPKEPASS